MRSFCVAHLCPKGYIVKIEDSDKGEVGLEIKKGEHDLVEKSAFIS